jgi:hypothetical protein
MSWKVIDRFKQHVHQTRRLVGQLSNPPSNQRERWLYELATQGRQPIFTILEEMVAADTSEAATHAARRETATLENAWITRLRDAGHPLTNHVRETEGERAALRKAAAERGRNLALSLSHPPYALTGKERPPA